ncbi:acyltransferase [Pseudomonas costantinii]|uniref:Acetyltransferase n=1 Tax=Pseudomonas costantinii TaxID=168469 RepID=A0A1S2V580_9PSED|nr:acyltransferase [Pseudomonas costantinii]NVZ22308.1 acyltransferase [Pseudomonas costantinii]OIN53839.1 acetyltransferase [Pseudomonas costantinii]SEE42898.1 Acetyltransferase (isoleucine patch superfamily) [Pseudomonas costantinii]
MKHRTLHSPDLRDRLPSLANELGVSLEDLQEALDWSLANEVIFEEGDGEAKRFWISAIDIEPRIEQPVARRLFHRLKQDVPAKFIPIYGKNWETLKDRWQSAWDMAYNIVINKIPSHHIRVGWLRLGGAKIGKGSSLWRNTEVLGIHNLVVGDDTVIGWHCQVDARAGLVIGNHVAIASHVLIIAGSHDLQAPEFWSISGAIYIEDYVWIGSRALIGFGTRLGYGSVVTANTVVGKVVAPYKIVGGTGAKTMGERAHDLNYKVGGKGLFTLFH